MTIVHRVLPPEPVADLSEHLRRRGGEGLEAARALDPDALIAGWSSLINGRTCVPRTPRFHGWDRS